MIAIRRCPGLPKFRNRTRMTRKLTFATGVCRLLMNQPDRAEEVFTSLQEFLKRNMVSGADLPELLNNLALALARDGKTPAAMTDLRPRADIDPDEDDYPFNLGLLALETKDYAGAADAFSRRVRPRAG